MQITIKSIKYDTFYKKNLQEEEKLEEEDFKSIEERMMGYFPVSH